MKRKLLHQIRNEWKSNVWLAVELLIVSVVVWFLTDNLWQKTDLMLQPMGVVTDNCFCIETSYVSSNSPSYNPEDSTDETGRKHVLAILDRLRSFPGVEDVAIGNGGTPYMTNFMGTSFVTTQLPDTFVTISCNLFEVSPEYVRLFGVRGTAGETPEQLMAMLERNELLLGNALQVVRPKDVRAIDPSNYKAWLGIVSHVTGDIFRGQEVGTPITESYDVGAERWHVGAIIEPIRRMEFEEAYGNAIKRLDMTDSRKVCEAAIFVKVKPEVRSTFRRDVLKEAYNLFHSGNRFIKTVTEISSIRQATQAAEYTEIRNYVVVMVFLLLCVFLGLLGTFWFRTQRRVSEMAIRKVNGATQSDIFRRLIGEGMLLLVVVTPLAMILDYVVINIFLTDVEEYVEYDFSAFRFAGTIAVTFGLMALMIVLGIWFPASRATRVDPALALKDE